jgi:hypothetical protein
MIVQSMARDLPIGNPQAGRASAAMAYSRYRMQEGVDADL